MCLTIHYFFRGAQKYSFYNRCFSRFSTVDVRIVLWHVSTDYPWMATYPLWLLKAVEAGSTLRPQVLLAGHFLPNQKKTIFDLRFASSREYYSLSEHPPSLLRERAIYISLESFGILLISSKILTSPIIWLLRLFRKRLPTENKG